MIEFKMHWPKFILALLGVIFVMLAINFRNYVLGAFGCLLIGLEYADEK